MLKCAFLRREAPNAVMNDACTFIPVTVCRQSGSNAVSRRRRLDDLEDFSDWMPPFPIATYG